MFWFKIQTSFESCHEKQKKKEFFCEKGVKGPESWFHKNCTKKMLKKNWKKKNDEHCQKLERNEKTAERQTKGNDEYGSPEQKISPQGLEPWSTGSINTMHSLNLIRRLASASVWLKWWCFFNGFRVLWKPDMITTYTTANSKHPIGGLDLPRVSSCV